MSLHLAVYLVRPNVRAVCHTHSIYATAYASSVENGTLMPVYVPSVAAKVGPVMVTALAFPGSEQLGENVRAGIRNSNGTLLSNHGVVAVGKDICFCGPDGTSLLPLSGRYCCAFGS